MGSKNQQDLLKYLGVGYTLKTIDQELTIYRRINNHYDIELSGASRKGHPISVFVWDISNGEGASSRIVERHFDITDWDDLRALLEQLTEKYQGLA